MGVGAVMPRSHTLRIKQVAQQGQHLCWAACAEMIMAFHGRDISQNTQTGGSLRRGWPDFRKFGFHYSMRAGVLSERALKIEIDRHRRPFLHSWKRVGGNGHMVVVYGYSTDQMGRLWVHVVDPGAILHANGKYSARRRMISYDEYCCGKKAWREYYAIFPRAE